MEEKERIKRMGWIFIFFALFVIQMITFNMGNSISFYIITMGLFGMVLNLFHSKKEGD